MTFKTGDLAAGKVNGKWIEVTIIDNGSKDRVEGKETWVFRGQWQSADGHTFRHTFTCDELSLLLPSRSN